MTSAEATANGRSLDSLLPAPAWMLVSAVLFSSMVALFKLLGSAVPVVEILFLRQLMVLVVVLPGVFRGFPGSLAGFRSAAPGLQILRVVLSAAAMLAGFVAVVHLPLAESTTISFTRVMFAMCLAALLLGEKVGPVRWIAGVAGLGGVALVAHAEGAWNGYVLLALVSAVCAGSVTVILKRLTAVDGSRTILLWHSLGLLALTAVPTAFVWQTPSLEQAGWIVVLGLLMTATQWCAFAALRGGDASAVAPIEYSRLLWSAFLGYLLFDHIPDPAVAAGAVLIVGAGVLASLRSTRKQG